MKDVIYKRILIVTALEEEQNAILEALKQYDFITNHLTVSRIGDKEIYTVKSGLGSIATLKTLKEIVPEVQPACVINFGTCGAISKRLSIGDIFIPDKIVKYCDNTLEIQNQVNINVLKDFSFGVTGGILGSCDKSVLSSELKNTLLQNLKLDAVDWEGFTIAYFCQKIKCRSYILKVVSDIADSSALSDFKKFLRDEMPQKARIVVINILEIV